MTLQNSANTDTNIIESMDQAFGNHGFYGLEYVLDEWLEKTPPPSYQNKMDSFGFWDFRD
ncbi:hypothetical protein [Methylovulum miyakonense]|uniref:hypothetical protein n=1 Tax=Methylovulum miyakonense TaxID=645578 RepID=UPI000370005D|nr:hypothetical protein [Methylovulum miyakonense]